MNIKIAGNDYTLLIGYQEDSSYRRAFNELAEHVFGLSFEHWYQSGFWNESYIPYTLFDGKKAVANISVNITTFSILGQQRKMIQLGTGMTDEAYRKQPLYPFLAKYILNEYSKQSASIYFFVNNNALSGLYTKLGFTPVIEHEYYKEIKCDVKKTSCRKLNMANPDDVQRLQNYIAQSKSYSKIAMRDNTDLIMFYCTTPLREDIYYLESLNTVAIVTFNNQQMCLWAVFSPQIPILDEIITTLARPDTNEAVLGFTPDECSTYCFREIHNGETLFVPQKEASLFINNKIMFPLLSHA